MSIFGHFKKAALAAVLSFCLGEYYFHTLNSQSEETKVTQSNQTSQMPDENIVTPPFRTIKYPHFTILYSTYHKSPLAVHEKITKEIANGDAPRARYFFADDHIKQKHFQVDNSYYVDTQAFLNFNLNRGHMAAAGNYSGIQSQKFHTFSFANVIPQDGTNNGGIWNTFERYSRDLAFGNLCESVEVISGPIYPKNNPFAKEQQTSKSKKNFTSALKVLKQDGIPIPQKLYKIIQCNSKKGTYIGSYQFLNEETEDNAKKMNEFQVSLEKIEMQSGLRFNLAGNQLKQLDTVGLNKTKKQIDYPFYFNLIASSTKISEMSQGMRRANSQKIDIQLSDLTEKIKQATQKQFQQIDKETITDCQKLRKLLSVSKKLYHLRHSQETAQIRKQKLKNAYIECRKMPNQLSSVVQDYKQQAKKVQDYLSKQGKKS